MTDPPSRRSYKGKLLRDWIDALVEWLRKSRVVVNPGSGLAADQTPGGLVLRVEGGGLIQVKTPAGGIAGRTGMQQHNAMCFVVTEDAAGLLTVGTQTVKVWNYSGGLAPGNKLALAAMVNGRYKLVSWEC